MPSSQVSHWCARVPFIGMGSNDDDWRFRRKSFYRVQPIVQLALFKAGASIPHEQKQGPVGEEELMRRVIDLLTTEIPRVQRHHNVRIARMSEPHLLNIYSMCCEFLHAKRFAAQPP